MDSERRVEESPYGKGTEKSFQLNEGALVRELRRLVLKIEKYKGGIPTTEDQARILALRVELKALRKGQS